MTEQIYREALVHYQKEEARFSARAQKFAGHQRLHYNTLARYAASQAQFWKLKYDEEQKRTAGR